MAVANLIYMLLCGSTLRISNQPRGCTNESRPCGCIEQRDYFRVIIGKSVHIVECVIFRIIHVGITFIAREYPEHLPLTRAEVRGGEPPLEAARSLSEYPAAPGPSQPMGAVQPQPPSPNPL